MIKRVIKQQIHSFKTVITQGDYTTIKTVSKMITGTNVSSIGAIPISIPMLIKFTLQRLKDDGHTIYCKREGRKLIIVRSQEDLDKYVK